MAINPHDRHALDLRSGDTRRHTDGVDIQKANAWREAMSDTTPLVIDKSGEESDPPDTPDAPSPAEPASTEIEFETVGSEHWHIVREGAYGEARSRLQTRYNAVIAGAQSFRDDAGKVVTQVITKPPEHLSGFGVVAEAVTVACAIVLPELGVAEEIAEALKGAYEVAKASAELAEKANQEVVAKSVEEAKNYLSELTNSYAEDVTHQALAGCGKSRLIVVSLPFIDWGASVTH
jgi:hypothetical protein